MRAKTFISGKLMQCTVCFCYWPHTLYGKPMNLMRFMLTQHWFVRNTFPEFLNNTEACCLKSFPEFLINTEACCHAGVCENLDTLLQEKLSKELPDLQRVGLKMRKERQDCLAASNDPMARANLGKC